MVDEVDGTKTILPPELWRLVLCRVEIHCMRRFACVCRQWHYLARDDNFWRSKLEEFFPMAESTVQHPGLFFARIWAGKDILTVQVLNLSSSERMFASAVLRCVSINDFFQN
jgi:hypothetical protein